MLDTTKIGHEFAAYTTEVEKGRLKFFCQAIGETNPIYTDEAAALAAGYRALPAPPTFTMVLDMEAPEFLPCVGLLQLDIGRILHGNQSFDYIAPICAGDRITVASSIKDMFDKKGGALEFVVLEYTYTNQHGELVAKASSTLVQRNG